MDKASVTSDLLASISGVLIFLSLAFWIDLNGFTAYSLFILAAGVLMLFWPRPFLKALSPVRIISKPLLLTISHILIFIGAKTYLDQFIEGYWFFYLILGIILLNQNKKIGKALFNS